MALVEHAIRELELAGVEEDVRPSIIKAVEAFASYGHSGGSASVCIPMLYELLQFHNLSPLTDDPDEWNNVTDFDPSSKLPLWQSRRRSEAFSHDGGKTYYLLSEWKRKRWYRPWSRKKIHVSAPRRKRDSEGT